MNIEERVHDIQAKLIKVCPTLTTEQIIPYSAERRYNLPLLFKAIIEACPIERAWVLNSRKHLADYLELVDPEVRRLVDIP
jgi:predicted GTPase